MKGNDKKMSNLNMHDVESIREDFPILNRKMRNGSTLVYLDNAATTQKPQSVVNSICDFYTGINSNIHRGVHELSEVASDKYDNAHQDVSNFLNAKFTEIVFTKNTTESMNIISRGLEEQIGKGDEIVVSRMEHHSNLVPFFELAKLTGSTIKYIELTADNSFLDLSSVEDVITDKTKIVTIPQMSNVLGTINPVKKIAEKAHEHGALIAVDGAQSVPHMKVDVKSLDIDFLGFSGHKMLAPFGIGGLYGKEEILANLKPLIYGGDMIKSVSYNKATWNDLPWKFEAGTPNVAGGIALGEAVKYINNLQIEKIHKLEIELCEYALTQLNEFEWVEIFGPEKAKDRGGLISFSIKNKDGKLIHPHDVSEILDEDGIAIRAGHHCAQPLTVDRLKVPATNRISFYIYNTFEEIDRAINQLKVAYNLFS